MDIDQYKKRSDILYAFCSRKPPRNKKEYRIGKKWQEWVYGSAKNPMLIK